MNLRPSQERALDAMSKNPKGQVIKPTGAGKTPTMIVDAIRQFSTTNAATIVVVAPRIMLAEQLSFEFLEHILNASVMHVHSGETHHFKSTRPNVIRQWVESHKTHNKLIFTTYNSLARLQQSGIDVHTIYFDEAHNSVKRNFFGATEYFSSVADRCYFFTATPKHSNTMAKPGMNDVDVYGQVICSISATEMVEAGYILPPTVVPFEVDYERLKGDLAASSDHSTLLGIVDELDEDAASKILVAVPSSKVMWNLLSQTKIIDDLHDRGYDILHITSKYGAWVNNTKVNREVFFDTFNAWGKDPSRKFIIFHYSILAEGINVHGLTHTILLRTLDVIEMAQTIGRVIRMNKDDAADIACGKIAVGNYAMYRKPTGFVTVPVFKNYGQRTIQRLQNLVDTVFVQGKPAISVINR
jgi:superfamily II DNA or RNA helicase